MAASLPQEDALALSVAAKSAFTDALGLAVLIGAGFSLVGVLIVARFMPARVVRAGPSLLDAQPQSTQRAPGIGRQL